MRRAIRAMLVVSAASLVVVLGGLGAVRYRLGDSTVHVQLSNPTEKAIRLVELTYSCGERRLKVVEADPPPGSLTNYFFAACGESSYRVHLTLADGSTVVSRGANVEPGYRMTELFDGSAIATSYGSDFHLVQKMAR